MNREIKFRLFDKVNKNMVYPSEKIYINMFGKIVLESTYDGEIIEANADEYVLMQYTGLKDKNGKEIYEGDILGDIIGYGIVLWIDDEVRFGIDIFGEIYEVRFEELEQTQLEIIGNIHENPELLEAQNDL